MAAQSLTYTNPALRLSEARQTSGRVRWRSPSNIALVKYWGKHGRQLPRNPSISLTLEQAATFTDIVFSPRNGSATATGICLNFRFEGIDHHPFEDRVQRFLEALLPVFPFLAELDLHISSRNTFPHSSGIASSASSMSALALALCDMERLLFGWAGTEKDFLIKASYIARLGSGSACRSVFPTAALWGRWNELPDSSDLYAIPCEEQIHPDLAYMHDTILLVDQGPKSVSSRAGHHLMEGNPFAPARYDQARERLETLWKAMKTGDMDTFGQITEAEALTLHALMMTSMPPYMLLKPNTLAILEAVKNFRASEKIPVYCTLDAGPNVHVLFPDVCKTPVMAFIESELAPYCQQKRWIADSVGKGPTRLDHA